LHIAQRMPLPLTVSCFSKIQIGFSFLVPAHPGSPGLRAAKRVCVCVCESKKQDTILLCVTSPNVNDFHNSFTVRLSRKFGHAGSAIKVLVAIHYSVLDARNGYIRNVVV